nr:hypothetical protein [Ferriphaselus amnicola]
MPCIELQLAQIHTCPRNGSGTRASTAAEMVTRWHQQADASFPFAIAHWLSPPHSGQSAALTA